MTMMGFCCEGEGEAVDSSVSERCLRCITSDEREIVGTMEGFNFIPIAYTLQAQFSSVSISSVLNNLRAFGPGLNPFAPYGMGNYSFASP
ncbi:hypothetical protein AAC387_Pa06g0248 [Persea americana]